eukprot:6474986-Amphidinium_carterae.1
MSEVRRAEAVPRLPQPRVIHDGVSVAYWEGASDDFVHPALCDCDATALVIPRCVELFAGAGRISRFLQMEGFAPVAYERTIPRGACEFTITVIDLADD